jgi:hypothetical protein
LITGDFSPIPEGYFDLESLFKNRRPLSTIEETVRAYFSNEKPRTPGIQERHLIRDQEAIQNWTSFPR